ncbi:MAG TPA: hypothetical protein VFN61_01585 [Acidimicrobiales bacterium]|nr:hypothetical protein [Acidimicrobiales bacterium]
MRRPDPARLGGAATFVRDLPGQVPRAAALGQLDPGVLARSTASGRTAAVWVTPLISEDPFYAALASKSWPSLVVAGSADPSHHPARQDQLGRRAGWRSLVVEGADHSLEVAGDVKATVAGLARVVEAVLDFTASLAHPR